MDNQEILDTLAHQKQDEDNKKKPYKTLTIWAEWTHSKSGVWDHVLPMGKQFLPLIKHQQYN